MTIEATPILQEHPMAVVHGRPVTEMPQDLYIPPNALEVFLEAFEGPLDLLLYLIKRQNFDILEIPIAEVTRQYISYIELMKELKLELAAEYLVMAAMLAEIKSRLLLPRPAELEVEEADPRAELIRRLQEYERIKQAAEVLDKLPQQGRDIFCVTAQMPELASERVMPTIELQELALAFRDILKRAALVEHHHIQRESLSIRERMTQILVSIAERKTASFVSLFSVNEGKMGLVVTFIALLELLKQAMIELFQEHPFGEIHVKAVGEAL